MGAHLALFALQALLALLERDATFAIVPLSCEALDQIVAVDGNDKGPDLQLEEILAIARVRTRAEGRGLRRVRGV